MTLEQVNQFSEMATVEVTRDWFLTVMWIMVVLVMLVGMVVMANKLVQIKREIGKIDFVTFLVGSLASLILLMGISVFSWAILTEAEKPLEGEVLEFKAKQTQWVREYVKPYVSQLPIQKENLKQLEYNYILGEKNVKNDLEENFEVPIKAVTESGKEMAGWAKVEPLNEGEVERIEYVQLAEELRFGTEKTRALIGETKQYRAGSYRIIVYTNQSLVD